MSFTSPRLDETRIITSDAGRMRSAARRFERKGFRGAAGEMALEAEKSKFTETDQRGSSIRSADAEVAIQRKKRREAELLNSQGMDATLGDRDTGSPIGSTNAPAGSTSASATATESFSARDARLRQESTLSGAFGRGAQMKAEQLRGRQELFKEMQSGSVDSAQARERATALGVSDKQFTTAVARMEGSNLDSMEASLDAPTGSALAEKNIATMGIEGATADYFRRSRERKAAEAERKENRFSSDFVDTASRPAPKTYSTFNETFGTKRNVVEPPTPKSPTRPIQDADFEGFETTAPLTKPSRPAAPVGVSREQAQANVRTARVQGDIPSYRDRMASGVVTFDDAGRVADRVKQNLRSTAQSMRNVTARTNAWADKLRTRISR